MPFQNPIFSSVNKDIRKIKDKIKIITVKKYLLISLKSILTFENKILFKKYV